MQKKISVNEILPRDKFSRTRLAFDRVARVCSIMSTGAGSGFVRAARESVFSGHKNLPQFGSGSISLRWRAQTKRQDIAWGPALFEVRGPEW